MLIPFTDTLAVDWAALDRLTDWYIDAGVSGLFPVSLSSEMYDLTPDERLAIVDRVRHRVDGRVPVVAAGTFGATPIEQAAFVRRTHDAGADAVVVVVPQMAAPDEDDTLWQQHVETLLDQTGDIPLGLYECPQPYKRLLSHELTAWTASTGRFLFLKDTSMDLGQMSAKVSAAQGSPLRLYNAHAPTLLDSLRAGFAGYCGIAASFSPRLTVKLCDSGTNADDAAQIQDSLNMIHYALRQNYPVNAKTFLSQRLDFPTHSRRVTTPLPDENRRVLQSMSAYLSEQEHRLNA